METNFGVLEMEISPEMEAQLIALFGIEEEMLDAEVVDLPNNIKRFTIKIPQHKGGHIKDVILRSIADLRRENLN